MNSFVPCRVLCKHFDCCSARGQSHEGGHALFASAPSQNPWLPVPLRDSEPVWPVEEKKERSPRPRKLRVPWVAPKKKVLPVLHTFELGGPSLHFKFVGLRERVVPDETRAERVQRLRVCRALRRAQAEGAFIERLQEENLAAQLRLLKEILKNSPHFKQVPPSFEVLKEEWLTGPDSGFVWPRKIRTPAKVRAAKVKNLAAELWAEGCLIQKNLWYEKRQLLRSGIKERRQKRRALVLIDERTHQYKGSLANALIKYFAELGKRDPKVVEQVCRDRRPQGQMDDEKTAAHGAAAKTTEDQKSNVVFSDTTEKSVSTSVPPPKREDVYSCLSTKPTKVEEKTVSDRWFLLGQHYWTGQKEGEQLFSYTLPIDVFKIKQFLNSPNFILFRQHVYWRGNMKIKITTQSNERQMGMLQTRFYSCAFADDNFANRNNIWTGSQMPHVLINAGSRNDAYLTIPFEYNFPVLNISKGSATWDSTITEPGVEFANLGTLVCLVLCPLIVAQTTPLKAMVSVYIAFEDNQYSGMIDSSLIDNSYSLNPTGQMFSLSSIAHIAEQVTGLDQNRDNPTFSCVGLPVIPINSGSWCQGTAIPEYSNVLRLNPRAVMPVLSGKKPPVNEMTVSYLCKTFGLFKILRVTGAMKAGDLLYRFDAAPLMALRDYPRVPLKDGSVGWCVPPVGIVSSMFAWWRGSLTLRLDLVAPSELTGRLLVAYIPRYYRDVDMRTALNCNCAIFDFGKSNRQFSFKIPYIADRPFWDRPKMLEDEFSISPSPGTVYIFINQDLIWNSTIPEEMRVLCYIAGGDDFEVSVPACPIIGNSFFPKIYIDPNSEHSVMSTVGYVYSYIGTYHGTGDYPVFRYGTLSNQVMPFVFKATNWKSVLYQLCRLTSAQKDKLNKCVIKCTVSYTVGEDPAIKTQVCEIQSAYAIFEMDSHGFVYGLALPWNKSPTAAQVTILDNLLLELVKSNVNSIGQINNIDVLRINISRWICDHTWMFDLLVSAATPAFPAGAIATKVYPAMHDVVGGPWLEPVGQLVFTSENKPRGQIDERSKVESKTVAPVAGACNEKSAANVMHGERFFDLKDFTRRYHLYAKGVVSVTESDVATRTILIKFPAMAQGLNLANKAGLNYDNYWNRTREGVIPLIAAGYRFYSGGIRFRIVVNCQRGSLSGTAALAKVFVQHRPDVQDSALTVTARSTALIGQDDIELPGYAAYHQFDDINNVISVEIPYYAPSVKLLLQRPTENLKWAMRWSNLGQVAVGVTYADVTTMDFNYEIYYSLADDANFSLFCGFPPVIDLTNIFPKPLDSTSISRVTTTLVRRPIAAPSSVKWERAEVKPQGDAPTVEDNNEITAPRQAVKRYLNKLTGVEDLLRAEDYILRQFETHGLGSKGVYLKDYVKWFSVYYRIIPQTYSKPNNKYMPLRIGEVDFWATDEPVPEGQGFSDWLPFGKTAAAVENLSKIDPEKVNGALDGVDKVGGFVDSIKDKVLNMIPTGESIKDNYNYYMNMMCSLISNLVHCIITLNIRTIIWSIISFFTQLGLLGCSTIGFVTERFSSWFTWVTSNKQKEDVQVVDTGVPVVPPPETPPEGQMEDDECYDPKVVRTEEDQYRAAYISSLIAGVAAALGLGYKMCTGTTLKDLMCHLQDGIRSFCLTANVIYTFIKNNTICIRKIGHWLIDDSVQMKDIQFLKDKQNEIHAWAVEAVEITDPWKERQLFSSMKKASRVYELSFSGNMIMAQLGNVKLEPQQYRVIEKLLDKLNRLKERLVKAHMAPPVRFEPFVYELTGPTGVGKSELLNHIPFALLDHLGLKFEQDIIYHRQIGNPHWNNCINQPVFSVDEKFPIMKPGFDDVQLSELFQIKSRCVLNPPMADLPDKNLRYNPIIAQYASNNAFPPLMGLLCPDAVYRRRDVLVSVQFTQEVVREFGGQHTPIVIKNLPKRFRHNFAALEFYFAEDVCNPHTNWVGPYTYRQFLYEIKNRFFDYYREEEGKFKNHLKRALSLQPTSPDDKISTFEEMWRAEVELETCEKDVKEFRDKYLELIDAQNLKTITAAQRQSKVYGLLYNQYGPSVNGVRSELSEAQISERIVGLRKELAMATQKYVFDRSKIVAPKPVGQGELKEAPLPTTQNYVVDCQAAYTELEKRYDCSCPHHFLNLLQPCGVEFDYIKEKNAWKISEVALDSKLEELSYAHVTQPSDVWCTKKFLALNSKNCKTIKGTPLYWEDDSIFIKHEPCEHISCPWREVALRHVYVRNYLKEKPTLKLIYRDMNMVDMVRHVPQEFVDHLKDELKIGEDRAKAHKVIAQEATELKSLYTRAKEFIMSIPWRDWFFRLSIILGVMFFLGSLFRLWGLMVHDSNPVVNVMGAQAAAGCALGGIRALTAEGQVHASGDLKQGTTQKKTPRSVASKALASLPDGQMLDADNFTSVMNCLKRNMFFLEMQDDKTGRIVLAKCMGIAGRTALIVDHYWEGMQNFKTQFGVSKIMYIPCQRKATACFLDLSELNYRRFDASSLGLLTLPRRFSLFRDIRSRIATRQYHHYQNGIGIMIEPVGRVESDNEVGVDWNHRSVQFELTGSIECRGSKIFSDFTTGTCYRYHGFTAKGKCGSVLLATSIQQPIVGFHVAGDRAYGYSEAIYREMFDDISNVETPSQTDIVGEGYDSHWFVDGEVIGIACVASKLAARANEKSKIVPSLVQLSAHSNFPVYSDVSVLSPNDPRIAAAPFSPMLEGCKFHGMPLRPFNREHLQIAIEDINNKILARCSPSRVRPSILPVEIAIGGIEGKDGYEHIEWNSSEGFPFVASRPAGAHNKKWLFNFNEKGQYISHKAILEEEMQRKWKLRLENIVPDTVFTDCLKDCRVPLEKVKQPGKTRIFSIAPVDFTIQQRQCTLDFVASYMENRLKLEHAIGINPDSLEWTVLAEALLGEKQDSILTGDYSKFGDTIPCEIIHAFYGMVAEWYQNYGVCTPEHCQQLKIMAYEVGNSKHLMFDYIYQVLCGQPSGNSLTVILNSYANSIYMRLAWLSIMENSKFNTLEDLHKYVTWFSYGDDLIASLHEDIRERFNACSLHDFFASYGLKFTNADKGDKIVPYTNLAEADFLKRSFAPHPTRKCPVVMLAPLKEESIVDTVNWVNTDTVGNDPESRDFIDMSIQVCQDALRNSFGKGPKYYNQFRMQLTLFWRKHKENFISATWDQLDKKVFDQGEILQYYFLKR